METLTLVCVAIALIGAVVIALSSGIREGWLVDLGILIAAPGALGVLLRGIAERDSYLADHFSTAMMFAGLDLVVIGVLLKVNGRRLGNRERRAGDRRASPR